jgi:hypothetical protein
MGRRDWFDVVIIALPLRSSGGQKAEGLNDVGVQGSGMAEGRRKKQGEKRANFF